jgi:TBC1 domain family member 8/9
MSEAQAFSLLSVLCDRLLPGYYSTTMYGTLLDQKVFESLVEKTMPILWEHLVKADVQLSVVSLPWFLSLYINSMPLVFAFRVLDVFFLEGPKVLFQVGLAILRMNGEELLDITDDGSFISILKDYFSRLDEPAHPNSENEKARQVTKFQELMVAAFREFSGITQGTISDYRAKHKDAVLDNIETFTKRTTIRNLGPESKRLSPEELSFLYDRFYGILYEQERERQLYREESDRRARASESGATGVGKGVEVGRVGLGRSPELMNYDAFRDFLAGITKWAIADSPRSPTSEMAPEHDGRTPRSGLFPPFPPFPQSPNPARKPQPSDHDFMQRLYFKWNRNDGDGLSLQDVVTGLAGIKGTSDLMSTIAYFFDLYDDDKDGKVGREGILRISEALLFLSRRGLEGKFTLIGSSPEGLDESVSNDVPGAGNESGSALNEKFLSSVSAFIRRCFEYADPDHEHGEGVEGARPGGGEDNLLDLSDESSRAKEGSEGRLAPASTPRLPTSPQTPSKQSANVALDPAHPLHITLPTFRMVILADELLQQFFEFSFAESFHTLPPSTRRASSISLQTPTLTTFSGLNARNFLSSPTAAAHVAAGAGAVAPPPSKGLRGLLDNVVADGMRMAAEVRKRMEEVQKEMEKNALGRGEEEEDEEGARTPLDPERGGVKEGDRALLEGAEVGSLMDVSAEAEGIKTVEGGDGLGELRRGSGEKFVEFES